MKIENNEVDNYYEFRKKGDVILWSRSGKALKDDAAPVMVRSRSRLEKVMSSAESQEKTFVRLGEFHHACSVFESIFKIEAG